MIMLVVEHTTGIAEGEASVASAPDCAAVDAAVGTHLQTAAAGASGLAELEQGAGDGDLDL